MKWSLPFISPFVLSLFSLVHRAPPAEASHLVLQTRLPGVKWLCRHLSSVESLRPALWFKMAARGLCGEMLSPALWFKMAARGLCGEMLSPALWFKMAARGPCAEMLTQNYDLESRAAHLSLSCENPPIPQLTRITHSSPRGAFSCKPVLYITFNGQAIPDRGASQVAQR